MSKDDKVPILAMTTNLFGKIPLTKLKKCSFSKYNFGNPDDVRDRLTI